MALGPGTRLGVYEILSLLGSGGMGEVYRATDTNLRRQVAVKVLPASVAGDPERLARFQREAEILATLNHPNIAQIHGMEEANGTQFLVLELVDGQSLNRRLIRGPIPVDEALGIAKQISEALEAAHDKGIIHRDLKPANIALTKEGRVKVLDFGLAKSLPATYGSFDVTNSPTITSPAMMTDVGVILGTAAYMAPEQAKGQDADNRSDIWAFGCVLFEMLTGKRAFGGEDASDTLANILKSSPDWQALPVDVPLAIRTLLKCCVEKDRHHRIDDVSTIQFLLRKYEDLSHTSGAAPRLSRKPYLVASAASALMIAVVALGLWTLRRSSAAFPSGQVTQLSMGLQPADSLLSGPGSNFQGRPIPTALVWAPNGRSLVFSGAQKGLEQLYVRPLDQLEAKPLPGTEGATAPFFSPDGQVVGFWARGELKKVPLAGGPTVTICRATPIFRATWADDDTIFFDERGSDIYSEQRIWRVAASGGQPTLVARPDRSRGEFGYRLPQVLPGGKVLLFTMTRAPQRLEDAQIMARSLERGTQQSVTQGTDARYVYPGYLIFLRLGTLLAAPFDATRLALTGGVVGLLDGVMQSAQASTWNLDAAAGQFSVSATGTLAYVRGGIFAEELRSLVWVDRSGSTNPIAMPSRQYWAPRLSSNGQRMAVYSRGREGRIWVHDFRTGTTIPLTDTGGISEFPVWMADSGLVTFALQADGSQNLFERVVDGSSGVARLTRDPTTQIPNAWSPDGTHLAFVQLTPSGSEIWILTRRHDGPITAKPWRTTHSRDQHADWSPDGQWIAYTSNESGRAEVYLQPYPGPGPRIPVSRDGGTTPVWSRNGRELFYLTSQGTSVGVGTYTMMAAPITLGPPVTVGMPQKLFEGRFLISATGRGYDVTPDGRRFVMVQPRQELAMPATEVVIVQNWLEELKARVPAR